MQRHMMSRLTQTLDFLCRAVNVEEGPHGKRLVDVHQRRNVVTVATVFHFT